MPWSEYLINGDEANLLFGKYRVSEREPSLLFLVCAYGAVLKSVSF
jgi:hypothetical protein